MVRTVRIHRHRLLLITDIRTLMIRIFTLTAGGDSTRVRCIWGSVLAEGTTEDSEAGSAKLRTYP
jgi:hypothetical protein